MTLTQLSEQILQKVRKEEKISTGFYPSAISLESEITKYIKNLYKYTNKNTSDKKIGVRSWEYGMSFLFFINKLYPSKIISGDSKQVSMNHSFNATQNYKNNDQVQFILEIDNKKVKTQWYDVKKIKTGLIYGFAVSFHTHPLVVHKPGVSQYSFFSPQDISTLVHGRIPIQGLISGKDLWLACKTSNSQMINSSLLQEASRIELSNSKADLISFVKNQFKEFDIAFYTGSIGSKLKKV